MGAVEWITIGFLVVAAWFDYRTLLIPNRLQLIAIITVTAAIMFLDPVTWKYRLMISSVLCAGFFILVLLKQVGAGDLKMMVWLGAGLGVGAIASLIIAQVVMVLVLLLRFIRYRQFRGQVALAPALAIGFLIWKAAIRCYGISI